MDTTQRTRNSRVILAWLDGLPATSWTGNLRTDGKRLWSYNVMIGYGTTVFNYTAPAGYFQSMTTSRHVGQACRRFGKSSITSLVSPSHLDDLDKDVLLATNDL